MRTNRLFGLLVMSVLVSATSLFAENRRMQRMQPIPEQCIEEQVIHMQKKLMLDDKTASKFAPLYKEYLENMECCMLNRDEQREPNTMLTDEQIDQQITDRFAARRKMLDTQEKYYQQFKKILTMRQLEKLFDTPCPLLRPRMNKEIMGPEKYGRRQFNQRVRRPDPAICPMAPLPEPEEP